MKHVSIFCITIFDLDICLPVRCGSCSLKCIFLHCFPVASKNLIIRVTVRLSVHKKK